jgi:hypothetical protein
MQEHGLFHLLLWSSESSVDKTPLWKRGVRGDLKVTMPRYNKNLKGYSKSLSVNMTEAERLLWGLGVFTESLKEHFYTLWMLPSTVYGI